MESYNPEHDDKFFPWIKIVGIGETGVSASNYFGDVCNEIFPERLIISSKDDIDDSRAKILDFIAGTAWLFAITDIDDLKLAAQVAECIEESKSLPTARYDLFDEFKLPLITFLILCKSAEDARLADIPENFGTWIILPEDKIAECGLTKNAAIYRTVDMTTSIIPILKKRGNLIGMGFEAITRTIGNFGRACVGFGESLDSENNSLQAVKNALNSSLFIEDIGKAKKALLVFVGKTEFLNMLEMNEAANFLDKLYQPEDSWDYTLWQVDADAPFDKDGVAAFVLATKFEK